MLNDGIFNTFDINLPTPVCPANKTIYTTATTCTGTASWEFPILEDPCDPNPFIINATYTSPQTFTPGDYSVTYSIQDASGNLDSCTFMVSVLDTIKPGIACPSVNLPLGTSPSLCGRNLVLPAPSVTDNCSVAGVTGVLNGFTAVLPSVSAFLPVGLNSIVYTAIDVNGNTRTCSYTVNVQDNAPPVINDCPINQTVYSPEFGCPAIATWTPPEAVDNCVAMPTLTSNFLPGAAFWRGTQTVTYLATANSLQSAPCSFTITVIDTVKPVVNCPANMTLPASGANCQAVATWSAPSATNATSLAFDNCGIQSIIGTATSPSTFGLGQQVIAYSVKDSSGNQATCSFTITVIDNTAPGLVCPSVAPVNANGTNCTATIIVPNPQPTDCSSVSLSDNFEGEVFPIGTTVITYTATDIANNVSTCSVQVIVNDNTPPVLAPCPSVAAVSVPADGCQGSVNWQAPVATDCNGPVSVTPSQAPGLFPLGQTVVTYTATDNANNTSTCTFTVSVVDFIPPVLVNCPAWITLPADQSTCGTEYTWTPPTATDNCGNSASISGPQTSTDFFPIGSHTITYTATDLSNNTSSCTFLITVQDLTPPSFVSCPSSIATPFVANAGCQSSINPPVPTPADNCGDVLTNNLPADNIFPIGVNTVVFTLTEPITGNTASCFYTITVVDNTPPNIIVCPPSTLVSSGANCTAPAFWPPLSIVENCSLPVTQTPSILPETPLAAGPHVVTIVVSDNAGNTSTCSFTITVQDLMPPAFNNCPSNITLAANAACLATATWPVVTATDNCSAPLNIDINANFQSNDVFELGSTTVVYTAEDEAGNTASCTFNVIVQDQTPPVIVNCPPAQLVFSVDANCQATPTWTAPSVSDNCDDNVALISNFDSGTITLTQGQSTVINYSATDATGNSAIPCSFTVTTKDTIPPIFNTLDTAFISSTSVVVQDEDNIIASVTFISCDEMLVFYNTNGLFAIDNCNEELPVTLISGPESGDSFQPGINTLVYAATDEAGNSATTEVIIVLITVPGNIEISPSEITCEGASIMLTSGLSPVGLTYSWAGPNGFTSSEFQPDITISSANIGTYSVTVSDNLNCTGSGTVSIEMIDVPSATTTTSDIPCYGGELTNTAIADASVETWTWIDNTGAQTNTQDYSITLANASNAGTYTLLACNSGVCCDTVIQPVAVLEFLPAVTLTSTAEVICVGQSATITATATPGVSFSWSSPDTGAGLPTVLTESSIEVAPDAGGGTYNYNVVTSLAGCGDTPASISVTVSPDPVPTIVVAGLDACETVGTDLVLNITNPGIVSWSWEGPGFTSDINGAPVTIQGLMQTGIYTVTVTNQYGCTGTGEVEIGYGISPAAPVVQYSGDAVINPNAGQAGEPTIFGCNQADLGMFTNPLVGLEYLWTGPNGINLSNNALDINDFGAANGGVYQLYAIQNGCLSEPTTVIASYQNSPLAEDDIFTVQAQLVSSALYVNGNDVLTTSNNATWNQLTSPAYGTIAGQSEPGVFTLMQDTTYGGSLSFQYELCSNICPTLCSEATVTVEQIIPCIIPNVITPNGDGLNDVLVLGCLQFDGRHPENELVMYNEWGDKVYTAKPYLNDWDGTNNSDNYLPDGTYFYIFRESAEVEWKKGFVALMRGL